MLMLWFSFFPSFKFYFPLFIKPRINFNHSMHSFTILVAKNYEVLP